MIGDGFSHMSFAILKDGEDIGIIRETSTNGRPEFKKTRDIFACGEHVFDALAPGIQRGDFTKWLDGIVHEAELRRFDSQLEEHRKAGA